MARGPISEKRIMTKLQEAFNAFAAKYDGECASLKTRVTQLELDVKSLTGSHNGMAAGLATVKTHVDALLKAAGNSPKPILLPPPRERDLLSLDPRDSKLDPVALQVLAKLGQNLANKDRAKVIKDIVDGGAGANSQKIAKALSQRRLPDMTHAILDLTLPDLLVTRFGAKITAKETEDTLGCVAELLTQLKKDKGHLRTFADDLVAETGKSLNITMTAEQTAHMAKHVYESLI